MNCSKHLVRIFGAYTPVMLGKLRPHLTSLGQFCQIKATTLAILAETLANAE